MPISPEQFAIHCPHLYHMAEAGVWPSIQKHGLLSTTALLDLFEVNGIQRRLIQARHRPESVTTTHPLLGSAVVRDQEPMRETALAKCLRGMSPQQWYETLNNRAFFWVTAERVHTLLNARAYRARQHTVITVSPALLLAAYSRRMFLSPINSGSTIDKPQPRGSETFRPFEQYPFEERRKLRGLRNAVAEAAVTYGVPDVRDFTVRVEHRKGEEVLGLRYALQ